MVLAHLALQSLTLLKSLVIDINWKTILELLWPNVIQYDGSCDWRSTIGDREVQVLWVSKVYADKIGKNFKGKKTVPDCNKWKFWNILSLQVSNLVPTSGNSLVVRRVAPGRIIVSVILNKHVVPHQIKPRILKLIIRRGQSNISIFFICVSCTENSYHHVV